MTRLLITTQAIDRDDPILGFFHDWVAQLAPLYVHIHVVCLRKGTYSLPDNVTIHSLGKESTPGRVRYIIHFFRIILRLRGEYDVVFSHMNPHYIVLAGWYWKLCDKPIFFWRNHARMNLMTEIAARFAKKVLYTSPFACTKKYAHSIQMPVGIDTHRFKPAVARTTPSAKIRLLYLGRLSPIKKIELCIHACNKLDDRFELHIYGDAPPHDQKYGAMLRAEAGNRVFFHGAVPNRDTPALYQSHDICLNLTPKGSMDKTVFEALACGALVVAANESFQEYLLPAGYVPHVDSASLKRAIEAVSHVSQSKREEYIAKMRERIIAEHSVSVLVERLGVLLQ